MFSGDPNQIEAYPEERRTRPQKERHRAHGFGDGGPTWITLSKPHFLTCIGANEINEDSAPDYVSRLDQDIKPAGDLASASTARTPLGTGISPASHTRIARARLSAGSASALHMIWRFRRDLIIITQGISSRRRSFMSDTGTIGMLRSDFRHSTCSSPEDKPKWMADRSLDLGSDVLDNPPRWRFYKRPWRRTPQELRG